ncbi:DUF5994 family protein [Kitasatospora purpeofusca]|uniref:DUF5994 family protein n=1 Tax=Kitasatospora purpeofusca TaxID=67352 RepID=A0ABZ1U290_9ACTN|nr:DUF5994 family protein [Kitasatospora purpeofusca]
MPLLPRLLLEPTMSRDGVFDGAWWPRSNHIAAELPDLITALGAHFGRIVRVGLDISAWDGVPRSVAANGLMIRINWFTGSDATISVTRGFQDHFLLLVVPPGTSPVTASSAMAGASATGNHSPAAELLLGRTAVGSDTGPTDRAADRVSLA